MYGYVCMHADALDDCKTSKQKCWELNSDPPQEH